MLWRRRERARRSPPSPAPEIRIGLGGMMREDKGVGRRFLRVVDIFIDNEDVGTIKGHDTWNQRHTVMKSDPQH